MPSKPKPKTTKQKANAKLATRLSKVGPLKVSRALVGQRIATARARLDISQVVLADRAGLSHSYVCLVEHGKRGLSMAAVLALSTALGVKSSLLITDDQMATYKTTMNAVYGKAAP